MALAIPRRYHFSAVSFISDDYTLQDPLQEKLIERTERIAQSIPIEQALTAMPVWRTTGFGVLPLAAMIALASLFPMITVMGYAQIGEWMTKRNLRANAHERASEEGTSS